MVYTVKNARGGSFQIDITHEAKVFPPSQSWAVCDLKTWGRLDSLTLQQAKDVAVQDFNERRKLGPCRNCFFHGKRDIPGEQCEQLCCAIRLCIKFLADQNLK